MRLAMIGSMNDDLLNIDELSLELISYLKQYYPGALAERYQVSENHERPVEILEEIAGNRNCIKAGGELDYSKAAALVIDEFRSGTIGRITLEWPERAEE